MLKGLLSLFLQDRCPLCDRTAQQELCLDCQRQLQVCRSTQPDRFWSADLPRFIWGQYEGKLKQAIAAMKYENHPQLGVYLGQQLAQAWKKQAIPDLPPSLMALPIPLHPRRYQERGFNQSLLIAQGFCRVTGYGLQREGIKRVRDTVPLFQLSPRERLNEVDQAFELGSLKNLRSQKPPLLLIDDIYTTGSTAKEVASLLQSHQFQVVGIAAIAQPLRRET
jgi:ComF family protein